MKYLIEIVHKVIERISQLLKGTTPSAYNADGTLRSDLRLVRLANGDVDQFKFPNGVPLGWRPDRGEIIGAELLDDEQYARKVGDPLDEYPDDLPLFSWNGDMGALKFLFTLADAFCGILGLGAQASGKTSAIGKLFAFALARIGVGILVLAAKKEEIQSWLDLAKRTGREQDVYVFCPENKSVFNFLAWVAAASLRTLGYVNVADLVKVVEDVCELVARQRGKRDYDFWAQAGMVTLKFAFTVAVFCERYDLDFVSEIVSSSPKTLAQVNDAAYRARNPACIAALAEARRRLDEMPDSDRKEASLAELDRARKFWLQEFPDQAEETRTSIVTTLRMLVSSLHDEPLNSMFMRGESTVTPDDIVVRERVGPNGQRRRAKIVVIGIATHQNPIIGRIASGIWKSALQSGALGRDVKEGDATPIPVLLFVDEAQNFGLKTDAQVQVVCRSYRLIVVNMTQNLPTNIDEYGGDAKAENIVRGYWGALQTHLYARNGEAKTIQYIQETVGKAMEQVGSSNIGISGGALGGSGLEAVNLSAGSSTQEVNRIFTDDIRGLRNGTARNNFLVDVYVIWRGNTLPGGKHWMKFTLNQRDY